MSGMPSHRTIPYLLAERERERPNTEKLTLLLDLSLPDGDHKVLPLSLVRHGERDPVQQLVLEEYHRVWVADRRLDEALGVFARPGRHDLESRDRRVPRRETLRVLGPCVWWSEAGEHEDAAFRSCFRANEREFALEGRKRKGCVWPTLLSPTT